MLTTNTLKVKRGGKHDVALDAGDALGKLVFQVGRPDRLGRIAHLADQLLFFGGHQGRKKTR